MLVWPLASSSPLVKPGDFPSTRSLLSGRLEVTQHRREMTRGCDRLTGACEGLDRLPSSCPGSGLRSIRNLEFKSTNRRF
jgi:hypothetical protein